MRDHLATIGDLCQGLAKTGKSETWLRNKMEDDFFQNYLIFDIEKEIAEKITSDDVIDDLEKDK